jgi:tRNA 2-thiouridine synthesizing protein A
MRGPVNGPEEGSQVNGLEEGSQVGAELSGAGPREATRAGVNGPALPVQSPIGGKISPLEIDPRDATRAGVDGPASPAQRGQESPLSIDLRGEICPFTFVRTKLALEELAVGAVLRVTVDHEPAIRNIPRSAIEWGQEVVGVSCVAPRTWAIDLRKRVR